MPRWVDEGIAILADSTDKQQRHARDFARALAHGSEFRLVELVAMDDYPPPGRWGAFYGQSASLVNFLVEQSGEAQFLEFVAASLEDGYAPACNETYGLSIAQLESRWRSHAEQMAASDRHDRSGIIRRPRPIGCHCRLSRPPSDAPARQAFPSCPELGRRVKPLL